MRVISGSARGRRLEVPKSEARPFLELARGALFNMLAPRLPGASVLDLYSGSGALAIEALSRGAASAVLVERTAEGARVCRNNLALCNFSDCAEVLQTSVEQAIASLSGSFDLILMDPPYPDSTAWLREGGGEEIASRSAALLAPDGTVALRFERSAADAPESWGGVPRAVDRTYGRSRVCLYRRDA